MRKRIKGSFVAGREAVQRLKLITNHLFWNADTTTARVILSWSSLVFALTLWIDPQGFNRQAYDVMRSYAPASVWAWLFFAHFAGVLWRFMDPKPRIGAALIVNMYGLAIWLTSTISINLSIHAFSPGTSVELINCFFGAWALYRTGLKEEMVSP